ncbi:DUF1786 domain-containing protein [Chloroflexota bacterium]
MKIITADIGTGTQDIFLYDSKLDIENGFKLILPSPTMRIFHRIREATLRKDPIVLTGKIMGGGPSAWAVESHLKAGLSVYSTPQAARTINDDLEKVAEMGVTLVSDDEVRNLPDSVLRMELKDFDYKETRQIFTQFGVTLDDLEAITVAVFDHGDAPPDVSDRQFRFDYLDDRIKERNDLRSFAFNSDEIPTSMTRLKAAADSCLNGDVPVVVMDTAPAAVLGATFDSKVQAGGKNLIANIGNFHTLAFLLNNGAIDGVFEHHTGLLNEKSLEYLLLSLAQGNLTHEEVFNNHGHGALIYNPAPFPLDRDGFNLVITGPRRNMIPPSGASSGKLRPYYAVPFGDMMITGCFGLLSACAEKIPELKEPILRSLSGRTEIGTTPWDA